MGYFDDLELMWVKSSSSNSNRPLLPSPHGALGLMLGNGAISVTEHGSCFARTPFVYFIGQGEVHAWHTPPGTIRENYWMALRGQRFHRIFSALHSEYPGHIIEICNSAPFLLLFQELSKLQHGSFLFQEELVHLVEKYVACIYSEVRGLHSDRYAAMFAKLCDDIQTSPQENWDFFLWAKEHSLSYDHFRKKFRTFSGRSPHEYVLHSRFHKALDLLRFDQMTIKEIADLCGFDNVSNFIRFFKKYSGSSPAAWRKNCDF